MRFHCPIPLTGAYPTPNSHHVLGPRRPFPQIPINILQEELVGSMRHINTISSPGEGYHALSTMLLLPTIVFDCSTFCVLTHYRDLRQSYIGQI